ncbi:MAG: choice-of-anchor V domain-containing protein [Bacteroidota bacterium]
MKKIYTLISLISITFFLSTQVISNPTGAPAGYSGSPADGQTCGSCHGVATSEANNVLTSNVPGTGYVPGHTYTITVTISGTTARKGFQVSPQNADGQIVGSLAAGSGSRLLNAKYITHSAAKTSTSSVWTFSWTAPIAGTGDVNLYGAFVNGYFNISKQTLTVHEQTSTNIAELANNSLFNVFPNPAKNVLYVDLNLTKTDVVTMQLISIDGKTNQTVFERALKLGQHQLTIDINDNKYAAGVYFLQIKTNNQLQYKKLIIE